MPHPDAAAGALLSVRGLKVHFPIQKGFFRRTVGQVKAVDGVDLAVRPRRDLGLVGESGCGKTTTGRALLRIYEPTEGRILYPPRATARPPMSRTMPREALRPIAATMRMIFQDPFPRSTRA